MWGGAGGGTGTGEDMVRVTFLVDGEVVATCERPPYRALWPLTPGTHQAMIAVRRGTGAIWRSEERAFVVGQRQGASH
ncbi:MAG: hypothetical protein HC884_17545 [Chloroflexaceae bacterium]|nr:hypothetical protein [Chloroflexaceae bacterium]